MLVQRKSSIVFGLCVSHGCILYLCLHLFVYSRVTPKKFLPQREIIVTHKTEPEQKVTTLCNLSSPHHLREMVYAIIPGDNNVSREARYVISLHDPDSDHVISKGILALGKYPSVDELHHVCAHSKSHTHPDDEHRYSIQCEHGHLFVEVGSAVGMVSLYAASRGMQVYAFDPILPNIHRLSESCCLNGIAHCLSLSPTLPNHCVNSSEWGPFSPRQFTTTWSLVDAVPGPSRAVESRPRNLAATAGGGGEYHAIVEVTSIDTQLPPGTNIEILLLTCQGYEYQALLGAQTLLASRRIKSIIWRRHPSDGPTTRMYVFGETRTLSHQDSNTAKLAELLLQYGYNFYNIEKCRNAQDNEPTWIPPDMLAAYLLRPLYNGDHPNIFSVLSA